MTLVGALQSLIFAGSCVLALALLTLAPRWMQIVFAGLGFCLAAAVMAEALHLKDAGLLLGGLMLVALFAGLDRLLVQLRRPVNSPSARAPGGADAPGPGGERAEGRSPSGLGVSSLQAPAGRAGRPCAFSGRRE
ncbi:hypothetical protein KTR66_04585 [Roseococcus sp. SDR]|uniref:hypothetical protein n=1 Tax=Roseococcus sp. SDR TaxID=2835532 RepID=UPI001BD1675F|nr:hypothetical protein [Roseococcus sp. SDR]MBS7789256.1 hypothetical protein [Roseococcus sp. SDR]MBV1844570.1 hypothetical protein [Roseococcus sp. SDR]